MKKLITLICLTSLFSLAHAQNNQTETFNPKDQGEQQTVFGPNTKVSGYGAFSIMGTMSDDAIPKIGGYGGVLFNRSLTIGGGGYGYTNDIGLPGSDTSMNFSGGYGGIFIEPIFATNKMVHLTVPVLIGGGSNNYYNRDSTIGPFEPDFRSTKYENFFMIEPGINLEVNLARFMRVGVTASYLFTTLGSSSEAAGQLENASIGFNIRFGWF